jgi:hypothetical protein
MPNEKKGSASKEAKANAEGLPGQEETLTRDYEQGIQEDAQKAAQYNQALRQGTDGQVPDESQKGNKSGGTPMVTGGQE